MPIFGFDSRGASRALLKDELEIKCDSCRNTFFVSEEYYYYDNIGKNEKAGSLNFSCPNCDSHIEIWFRSVRETNGETKYKNVGFSGAQIIKGFGHSEITFGEEIYTLDESLLYLPEQQKIVTCLNNGVIDLIENISKNPQLLYALEPGAFEELIATIFSRHGFQVELTKKTRDGGRDIIAIRSDLGIKSKYIIECKKYASHCPVRVDLVRNLYGVQMQEGANKSVLATTSFFTPDAREFANKKSTTEWAMDLKDYDDVVSWVSSTKKS